MSSLQIPYDDYGYPLPDTRQQHSYPVSDSLMQHSRPYSQEPFDAARSHSHYSYAPLSTVGSRGPQDAYLPPYSFPHGIHASECEADHLADFLPPPPPVVLPGPPHRDLAAFNPNHTFAVLQNLQSVIDSTHTTRTQYAQAQSEAEGALTGALDPRTGDFQPTVHHQRQRTQHACEPCRERKVKCSGDLPCQYCSKMGKECLYGERKMRGPNKRKREEREVTQPMQDSEPASELESVPESPQENTQCSDEYAVDTHLQAAPRPAGHYRNISVYSVSSESAASSSSSGQASTSQFLSGSPPSRPATATISGPSSLQSSPSPRGRPRASTIANGHIGAGRQPASSRTRTARSRPSRPPPLNLSTVHDDIPQVPGVDYASSADPCLVPAEYTEPASTRSIRPRPTSLPAYLVDQYSRAARDGMAYQGVPDSSQQEPYYTNQHDYAYNALAVPDAVSVHTRSNSSDISTSISPASYSPASYSRELQYYHPASAPPGDPLSFDYPLDVPVSAPADVHMLAAALNYPYPADAHMEYNYGPYAPYAGEADAAMDVEAYAPPSPGV
ncbi:hypothetical protein C8Q80DRAFT_262382 [Daedaleopsis nitida]|nr:hypothetical protein C8Q80DRAFT_262382 [Daedaleopsis nitida]